MKAVTLSEIEVALNLASVYDFPENMTIVIEMNQKDFDKFQEDNIGEVRFTKEIIYNSKTGIRCLIKNLDG